MSDLRSRGGKILDRCLIGLALVFLVFALRGIASVNQDADAIDRGQQATNCIGLRQDLIDKWRAVATFEFVHQVDRLDAGREVDTSRAEKAEEAIYLLVDEKQRIRDHLDTLITDGDTAFDCPPVDPGLIPPAL